MHAFYVNPNATSMAIALIRTSAIAILGILVRIAKLIVAATGMAIAAMQILASVMMDMSLMILKGVASRTVSGGAGRCATAASKTTAHLEAASAVDVNVGLDTQELNAT